jgi:RNA polymerase sigma-70 factor, ECF subfamily
MRAEIEHALELLRSREPASLERALELLQDTVFSFSMRVCGHREDAEDTAQEVLLKSIPYLGKFDSPKALGVWLYTVARNRCWMSRRKSKFVTQQLSLDELMPDAAEMDHMAALAAEGASPELMAMQAQDVERVKQAILRVPPQYRLVLVLHDIEELSTDEIAKILGITEGNVRVRSHRARLFVRKELAQLQASPAAATSKREGEAYPAAAAQAATAKSGPATPKRLPRCKQIFANLSNYMDGVLDDSLCEELEKHMTGCRPCEMFLASLQNTVTAMRHIPGEPANVPLSSEVRSRLHTASKSAHPSSG